MTQITRVGTDLAKRVIQVHAVDASGKLVINRAPQIDQCLVPIAHALTIDPPALGQADRRRQAFGVQGRQKLAAKHRSTGCAHAWTNPRPSRPVRTNWPDWYISC